MQPRMSMPESETTTDHHPWYAGGCDALGPDGTCAECGVWVSGAWRVVAACIPEVSDDAD
jgi:hypothetical protein